ncbi:MAG: methyl-accepting chemotaxis protein [Gammaproteobacteria bacterium]|nr:methyl-accepting chemotaxis protein [Gammaproteobacteria bacterium]
MRKSILRQLFISFVGFGLFMGVVFPFYADFFVEWKPGMLVWFAVGCLVAGSSIGVFSYAITKKVLINKLTKMSAIANAIAQRDVSGRCIIKSEDVIGEIANSMNTMSDSLGEFVGEVVDISLDLSNVATDLERQAHSTQNTIADQREKFSQIHEQLGSIENSSAQSLHAADQSVSVLTKKMKTMSQSINVLVSHNNEITSLLQTISQITSKTTILSLNASIESARAGEAGKGFAVVAAEINLLAKRTQETTNQILEISSMLTKDSAEAMAALQEKTTQNEDMDVNALQQQINIAKLEQANAITEINDKLKIIESLSIQTDQDSQATLSHANTISEKIEMCVNIGNSYKR